MKFTKTSVFSVFAVSVIVVLGVFVFVFSTGYFQEAADEDFKVACLMPYKGKIVFVTTRGEWYMRDTMSSKANPVPSHRLEEMKSALKEWNEIRQEVVEAVAELDAEQARDFMNRYGKQQVKEFLAWVKNKHPDKWLPEREVDEFYKADPEKAALIKERHDRAHEKLSAFEGK